jgi:hypothetical protein
VGVQRFVLQGDEPGDRIGRLRLQRSRRVLGARRFPSRRDAQLVLQLDNNPFGGLLPNPLDLREEFGVSIDDRALEVRYADAAEDVQRRFRPDPRDVIDEQPKQIALRGAHESVEHVRIFPHLQVR